MREMKDSGAKWLGLIPNTWNVHKLKFSLRRNDIRKAGQHTVLSLYREFGVIPKDSRDDNHNVTSEDTSKYKFVQNGDFVINKMKAWQGSVGVSKYEGIVSPAYYVYNFINNDINKDYFHYLIRSNYKHEFRRLSGGIREGQWDLPSDALDNTVIIIPPLEEQRKIADFLDQKCSEIDALTADIQTQIETLEEYKKSVITEAVTKGLDPNVEMKDSGVEWIGKIYKDFAIKRIKHSFNIFSGGTPNTSNTNYWDGDIPWLTPADFKTSDIYVFSGKRNITKMGYQNCSSAIFPKNSIIFSKRAPIGTVALAANKLCINQGCFALVNKGKADTKFYYYVLSIYTTLFDFFGSGTTFKEISALTFKNIVLPCPPITEQHKIADFLDQKCSEIDQTISEKQQQLETLAEYKKSLIYEYVTGKKEVA